MVELSRRESHKTEFSLVAWAPSIVDDESDSEEDPELILAVTHNEKAEVLSLGTIVQEHGNKCLIDEITTGRQVIANGHSKVRFQSHCDVLSARGLSL